MWCWDFIHDRDEKGRPLRWLVIEDEYTREGLSVTVSRSMKAGDVLDVLSELMRVRGVPRHIRSDTNGTVMMDNATLGDAPLIVGIASGSTAGVTATGSLTADGNITGVQQLQLGVSNVSTAFVADGGQNHFRLTITDTSTVPTPLAALAVSVMLAAQCRRRRTAPVRKSA